MSTAASTDARVPFLDLSPTHEPFKAAVLSDIEELIDESAFILGDRVARFEAEFAAYCGAPECVGLASGLDAIRLALIAYGIAPGDGVIVPAQTFVATFEAVTQAGGVPIPVDVDPQDYCLDPSAVEAALSARVRFLIPVHLYGQMADMRTLGAIAARADLTIVEDACQAHGARRDGIGAGQDNTAAFSFYPGKNLGAFGDAGAITTRDTRVTSRVRALREHGQVAKYKHEFAGYTSRLDAIQAIVLSRKLSHLATWTDQRRSIAAAYLAALCETGDLVLPAVPEGSEPVWHLYVVRTADPLSLASHLAERGVATGRHYPDPVHLSDAYQSLGYREGSFPVAEALARECISLPIYPGMTADQVEHVVAAIRSYFDGHA